MRLESTRYLLTMYFINCLGEGLENESILKVMRGRTSPFDCFHEEYSLASVYICFQESHYRFTSGDESSGNLILSEFGHAKSYIA